MGILYFVFSYFRILTRWKTETWLSVCETALVEQRQRFRSKANPNSCGCANSRCAGLIDRDIVPGQNCSRPIVGPGNQADLEQTNDDQRVLDVGPIADHLDGSAVETEDVRRDCAAWNVSGWVAAKGRLWLGRQTHLSVRAQCQR